MVRGQSNRSRESCKQKRLQTCPLNIGHNKQNFISHIKDKNGSNLTAEDAKLKRCSKHFQEVLNREEPEHILSDKDYQQVEIERHKLHQLSWNTSAITGKEVRDTISQLKNGKAKGVDNIDAEILKAGDEIMISQLSKLFTTI